MCESLNLPFVIWWFAVVWKACWYMTCNRFPLSSMSCHLNHWSNEAANIMHSPYILHDSRWNFLIRSTHTHTHTHRHTWMDGEREHAHVYNYPISAFSQRNVTVLAANLIRSATVKLRAGTSCAHRHSHECATPCACFVRDHDGCRWCVLLIGWNSERVAKGSLFSSIEAKLMGAGMVDFKVSYFCGIIAGVSIIFTKQFSQWRFTFLNKLQFRIIVFFVHHRWAVRHWFNKNLNGTG